MATDISATFLEFARAKSARTGDRCDAVERSVFRAYRWWTIDELATIVETIDPAHIAALLRAAGAIGDVDRGFDGPYRRTREPINVCLNVTMVNQIPPSSPTPSLVHRILERLTAAKTHVGMLRRRLRRGQLDRADAEDHLVQIEGHIDEATALAENLRGQSSPPP